MVHLASVFKNGDSIDSRVGPLYSNSRGQVGLVVAAWDGSQWLQMISPRTLDQAKDTFSDLADKIRADKTLDPQPLNLDRLPFWGGSRLQELEDALKNIRGREEFDW
jgi:hypothetical protein